MTPQEDYVINTVNSRDVHFIRCWFVDVLGQAKSLAIVPNELERAFDIGIPLDGNCIAGFESRNEADIIAWPDASTFQILPWRPDEKCVARMFCITKNPDGTPFESDSRFILSEVLKRASEKGYLVNMKPEIEFFYFKSKEEPKPLDFGSSFDLTSLDSASDLRRDTVLTLESIGIPVRYSHHEMGAAQNEIELRTTDAMSMADSVLSYKLAVKEVASKHGVYASFMPKPLQDQPGNSMHLNIHLTDKDGVSVFYDENSSSEYKLTELAKQFMAGVLKYASEFCLLTNQYQNSYKRLIAKTCKCNNIAWSRHNLHTMMRLPGHRPDTEEGSRIVLRNPDPACNPYLAFAAIINAGLAGIEEKLELEDPKEETSKLEDDCKKLPSTLGEAIESFKNSKLMRETLGEQIFNYLIKIKSAEWKKEISTITEHELKDYLAVL